LTEDTAGVTLINAGRGPGVRVSKVIRHKMAWKSGLKVGDHILSLNGVPCYDHAHAITVIDKVQEMRGTLQCVLKKPL
jgi:C-terminal processing protease CtpA/Prc